MKKARINTERTERRAQRPRRRLWRVDYDEDGWKTGGGDWRKTRGRWRRPVARCRGPGTGRAARLDLRRGRQTRGASRGFRGGLRDCGTGRGGRGEDNFSTRPTEAGFFEGGGSVAGAGADRPRKLRYGPCCAASAPRCKR